MRGGGIGAPCAIPSRRITDEQLANDSTGDRVWVGDGAVHDPDDVGGDGDMEMTEVEMAAEKVIDLWENGGLEARFVFQTSLVSQTLQALSDALARERVHRMNAEQSLSARKPL